MAVDVDDLQSDSDVQSVVGALVCKRMLQQLASCSSYLAPGWTPRYRSEFSRRAVEGRLTRGEAPQSLLLDGYRAAGQDAAEAASSAEVRAQPARAARVTGVRTHNPTSSRSRLRRDLTLVLVNEQQEQQQQQQQGGQQPPAALSGELDRPALVLELKRPAALMAPDGTPVDLLELYKCERLGIAGPGQGAPHVQPMFGQLYTSLLNSGACHGVLTCYGATWLVYVPRRAEERGLMYASRPFLAVEAGSTTMLRALSWLQQQAIRFATSDEYPAPPPLPEQPPQQHGRRRRGGGGSAPASGGGSGAAVPAAEPPELAVQLRFRSVLCRGRDGTVYDGLLDPAGTRVVIKVYCFWDPVQAAAYGREVRAYQALARLQGGWFPRVLANGRLAGDLSRLRCLVMEPVAGGQRLSDHLVWPFPGPVVDAALEALREAHKIAGFLHGDIRLENVLLVTTAAGGGGSGEAGAQQAQRGEEAVAAGAGGGAGAGGSGAPGPCGSGGREGENSGGGAGSRLRCVLLDFGGSRLDGTAEEQAGERAELRRLCGSVCLTSAKKRRNVGSRYKKRT